nr:unnamed protein product [Spirometra erinaceieuropaei]
MVVTTIFGLLESLHMPFGLRNTSQTFQSLGCKRNSEHGHGGVSNVCGVSSNGTTKIPSAPPPTPDARFSHVNQDIVGLLPLSDGCSDCLTSVCRFTRGPEAIPLPDIAAPTVVKAFLSLRLAILMTDRGTRLESKLFQFLLSFLHCPRTRTAAYHPAANGMLERFHRQLKASLRAVDGLENWMDHIPLVLFGIHSSLKSDLDCSAVELVCGVNVRLPVR